MKIHSDQILVEKMLLLNQNEYYYYKHKLMIMKQLNIDTSLLFTTEIVKQNIDLRTLYNAYFIRDETISDRLGKDTILYLNYYRDDILLKVHDIMTLDKKKIFYCFSSLRDNYNMNENIDNMYYDIFADLFSYEPIIVPNNLIQYITITNTIIDLT